MATKNLNQALELEPDNASALIRAGDFAYNNKSFETALDYYTRALDTGNIKDEAGVIGNLISANVELERYDDAILLSEKLLDSNPDNADTYFNVGVIYQRLASNLYYETVNDWKQITAQDKSSSSDIEGNYNDFKQTLYFIESALGYFLDSSMAEEEENPQTEQAISDMKRLRKSVKNIYLDSIKQIAKDNNVELN